MTPRLRDAIDRSVVHGLRSEPVLAGFLDVAATTGAARTDREGRVTASNTALRHLLGGAIVSLVDSAAEGQEDVVRSLLADAGGEWRSARVGLRDPDGGVHDCRLSTLAEGDVVTTVVELLYEPADQLNAALLSLNDELIGARRELAAGNRKLRELDEVKNMFIASATHDLKTPISSIVGYAELLADDPGLEADARSMTATISRNAQRLASMIDDLLGAALVISGDLQLDRHPADVAQLVADAVDAMQPIAAAHGSTIALTAREPVEAEIDARRTLQILDNLLSNAIKYSPQGGTIEVACTHASTHATITVTDSGIGISPADLAKLFNRFFRAESARDNDIPGTGLGLANARAFAEAHGGTLTCASELGVGSTFTVQLPLRETT